MAPGGFWSAVVSIRGSGNAGKRYGPRTLVAEGKLVALGTLAAFGRNHDAGIMPEGVESRFLLEESLGCGLHGCQVGKVEGEELNQPRSPE